MKPTLDASGFREGFSLAPSKELIDCVSTQFPGWGGFTQGILSKVYRHEDFSIKHKVAETLGPCWGSSKCTLSTKNCSLNETTTLKRTLIWEIRFSEETFPNKNATLHHILMDNYTFLSSPLLHSIRIYFLYH